MSAARAKKKQQEEFNLFDALKLLEKEKGIPVDYMIEKIQTAIAQAIKKDPFNSENSVVEIDPETGRFYVALRKDVVEEVEDPTVRRIAPRLVRTLAEHDLIDESEPEAGGHANAVPEGRRAGGDERRPSPAARPAHAISPAFPA